MALEDALQGLLLQHAQDFLETDDQGHGRRPSGGVFLDRFQLALEIEIKLGNIAFFAEFDRLRAERGEGKAGRQHQCFLRARD